MIIFVRTRDDLKQAHFEIERELDSFISSIKLGVNYTDRSKDLSAVEAYLIPAGGASGVTIPDNLLLDPVHLDRGIGDILTYDPRKLVGAGLLERVDAPWGDQKAYHVEEKLWTPYLMALINSHLGSTDLTGNVGVQFVHTDQSSTGLVGASGVPTLIESTKGRTYWEVLPSLNLSFRFPSDWVIRFALSKQHMRPRMPDMANNFNYFTDLSLGGIITGRRRQSRSEALRGDGCGPELREVLRLEGVRRASDVLQAHGPLHRERLYPVRLQRLSATDQPPAGQRSGHPVRPGEHRGWIHLRRRVRGHAAIRAILAGSRRLRTNGRRRLYEDQGQGLQRRLHHHSGLFEMGREPDRILREQRVQRSRQHALSLRLSG